MKTDLRPDAATIKRYSSPCLYTVFNEWSHYSAREGRSEKRKCVSASFSLPFPSFLAHCLSHLSPASWWHKEASVEEEVADEVIFGKEISKIGNDWKKTLTFRVYDPSSVWEKTVEGRDVWWYHDDIIFGTQCCSEFQVERMKMTLWRICYKLV